MPARQEHPGGGGVFLTDDDAWIRQLTTEDITTGWLQCANAVLAGIPTDDCQKVLFYEELLGLDGNTNGPGQAYQRAEARDGMPDVRRFVRLMRTLAAARLEFSEVVDKRPDIWTIPELSENDCIAGLVRYLSSSARVERRATAHTTAAKRKQREMYLLAPALGKPLSFVSDLLDTSPRIGRMGLPRIRVHARLLQRYGNADMGVMAVRELLQVNPDRHLVAVDEGIDSYTGHFVSKQTTDRSPLELRQQAKFIIDDRQAASDPADARLIQSFKRYHKANPVFKN